MERDASRGSGQAVGGQLGVLKAALRRLGNGRTFHNGLSDERRVRRDLRGDVESHGVSMLNAER